MSLSRCSTPLPIGYPHPATYPSRTDRPVNLFSCLGFVKSSGLHQCDDFVYAYLKSTNSKLEGRERGSHRNLFRHRQLLKLPALQTPDPSGPASFPAPFRGSAGCSPPTTYHAAALV